ncbi:MAG: hypothetical protein RLZZ272_411 [Actinomycetota bacterium]
MEPEDGRSSPTPRALLALGALGVVFGDIGTSPIYAMREALTGPGHAVAVSEVTVLGVASLAFWALVLLVSIKYIGLVMRADNRGEGGVLALTALLPHEGASGPLARGLVTLGVFGAALLYGDGIITPAISVLSAVEGLEEVSPALGPWVVPLALVILVGLFAFQHRGTAAVASLFGPVMLLWFTVLGALGVAQLLDDPSVLRALDPMFAVRYFEQEGVRAFLALGAIFLVVTGGEALFADMGHFGRRPIALAWYAVALPALLLNYFGQAALLLGDPELIGRNFFFLLAPPAALPWLVGLSTVATVVASQALVSGVFSITAQAIQLDYLPRLEIRHTSTREIGQVYVPAVNWALLAACIGLVVGFGSSERLAAAYGIAVTMTMVITTLLFARVTMARWGWSRARALVVCTPLLLIESAFLAANLVKVVRGGWIALAIGGALVLQMTTWRHGRRLVAERQHRGERSLREVIEGAADVPRVEGTAVFLFKEAGLAPPALVSNLQHNHVLHRTTAVVAVATETRPRVRAEDRVRTEPVVPGVVAVRLAFGFMEQPDVPTALRTVEVDGERLDVDGASYFLGHESVVVSPKPGMHPLRERLFVLLYRGADSAARFFRLPQDRVYEVGARVEI